MIVSESIIIAFKELVMVLFQYRFGFQVSFGIKYPNNKLSIGIEVKILV